MAELFIACPECGLREKLIHSEQQITDDAGQAQTEPDELPHLDADPFQGAPSTARAERRGGLTKNVPTGFGVGTTEGAQNERAT